MIIILISPEEVIEAKRLTEQFDKQKSYNKFECKHNYIGVLGELVLHRYLKEQCITHTWVEFLKDSWDKPDFLINDKTVDLKTTRGKEMWFQQPKFDIYIHAVIEEGDELMVLEAYSTSDELNIGILTGVIDTVTRDNRVDHVIKPEYMNCIWSKEDLKWKTN